MKIRQFLPLVLLLLVTGGRMEAQPTARLPKPGHYIVPSSSLPFIPGSSLFRQGGFSGLFHAGGNEFWTITDRGPNVDFDGNVVFLVPDFRIRMFKIRLNDNGVIDIIDSLTLTRTGGGPTSGLANPAPYNTGQISYDEAGNVLPDDDWGFDTEGILIAPDGTFWFCDEYAPGIAQAAATGEIIRRVRPQPSDGLPDILKRRRPNRGCEGIAMTPNGKLYTIVQSGMENSYSGTDAADVAASQQTELLRLVEFDPATGSTRMFAYMMDAGYNTGGSGVRRRDIKIGDMAAVNDNELLLIEHAERGSRNVKLVYKVDLRGATPITQEAFEVSPGVFKSLEELTRAQVSSVAGITPVSKSLVIDLLNPGDGNPAWPLEADKPEGMAILNSTTLVIGNDNDFGVLSPDEDGNYIFTGKQLHTLVYRLDEPLNFRLGAQGTVRQESNDVQSGSPWFVDNHRCLGEAATSLPMSVTNNGTHDIVIYGADIYRIDTTIVQGNPAHPLSRTPQGAFIRSTEYAVTDAPALPPSADFVSTTFPVVVEPGETWNFYLNYSPDRRGSRYARLFLRSNMVGVFGEDPNSGESEEGLLTLDLFGKGDGGALSATPHYVFPPTEPGSYRDTVIVVRNIGECDLRIADNFLSIDAGDDEDFTILSRLPNSGTDGNENFVIPAGGSDAVTVRFSPKQQGSRRATLTLRTNDSSLVFPGISERGAAYIDLYGFGVANIRIYPTVLPPAVIGGPSSSGKVVLENGSITPVDILRIEFAGDTDDELKGEGWPKFPTSIGAGKNLELGVTYTPAAGSAPGVKTRKIVVHLSNGKKLEGTVTVIAGTRELTITPANLFGNLQVSVGDFARRTLVITNAGTLPVTLGELTITGPNATNYALGPVPRRIIEPGQQEFIEVTFKPVAAGPSAAELIVPSNALNGPHKATLGGISNGTNMPGEGGQGTFGAGRTAAERTGSALRIEGVLPQPARDRLQIEYSLPAEGQVRTVLYDVRGEAVRTFEPEAGSAGPGRRVLDLRGLSAGLYYIRLSAGTEVVTAPVVIAR